MKINQCKTEQEVLDYGKIKIEKLKEQFTDLNFSRAMEFHNLLRDLESKLSQRLSKLKEKEK